MIHPIYDYDITPDGMVFSMNGKKIKHCIDRNYYKVTLRHGGKKIKKSIHRLVAETFIPNHENKPQVNHINGIRNDNRVENLEWCTASENQYHSYKILKRTPSNLGKNLGNHNNAKGIVMLINDIIVFTFSCQQEAIKKYGFERRSLWESLKKGKKINGFNFKYCKELSL